MFLTSRNAVYNERNEFMNTLLAFSLGLLLPLCSTWAQSEPTPSEESQETQEQLKLPEMITFSCEVLNPEELRNSNQLGSYSIRKFNSVNLAVNPQAGLIGLSIKLDAGRFSLAPIHPRVYRLSLKSAQAVSGEILLKNVDREEQDKVILAPNLTEGKIIMDDAELHISCEENI